MTGTGRLAQRVGGARRRRMAGLSGAALLVGALASCALPGFPTGGDSGSAAPTGAESAHSAPAGQEALAKFYSQKLTWSPCERNQCSWLEVPIDYAKPEGETVRLRLLRVPASGQSKGALFVNPGGPGGSATQYASMAPYIATSRLRDSYDIVGLDPRGVGESNPITCIDDAAMDQLMGADPTPDTPEETAGAKKLAKDFGDACQKKYPALLGHVSTVEAAKDMDVARAALGQPKMNYLGKSYGTYLGSIYADLFPTTIDHMVLDGAMPPDLTDEQLSLGQAQGFETATKAYVEDCVKKGSCPLGDNADSGMRAITTLLKSVDAKPLPVKGDQRVTELGEGWATLGMAGVMYSQERWPDLTTALRGAANGDGTELFRLALDYVERKDGHYTSNIMQVINAVNCLDHPVKNLTPEQEAQQKAEFAKAAPTWGPYMAGSSYTCLTWPVPPTATPHPVAAQGAPPIVVVGTTRDPATPYYWAQQLAKELAKGRLITFDGDGHTAYTRSNKCVDNAVDDYLIDSKVPAADVNC